MSRKQDRVLFIRIGWMKRYAGVNAADQLFFEGQRFKVDRWNGHEARAFKAVSGWCYGGFWPQYIGDTEEITNVKLERLGALKRDLYVDDVLVILLARAPGETTPRLIGFYERARVYRQLQILPWDDWEYNVAAPASNVWPSVDRPQCHGLQWYRGTYRFIEGNDNAAHHDVIRLCKKTRKAGRPVG